MSGDRVFASRKKKLGRDRLTHFGFFSILTHFGGVYGSNIYGIHFFFCKVDDTFRHGLLLLNQCDTRRRIQQNESFLRNIQIYFQISFGSYFQEVLLKIVQYLLVDENGEIDLGEETVKFKITEESNINSVKITEESLKLIAQISFRFYQNQRECI